MSVNSNEDEAGGIQLPADLDSAFAALMDVLAPEPATEEGATGAAETAAPASTGGSAVAPAEVAGREGTPAGGGPLGAAGEPTVPAAGGTGAAPGEDGAGSAVGSVDFADIRDDFGRLSVSLEEESFKLHQNSALEEVQTEYPKYFEALKSHPRMLVGQQVPAIGKEGTEVLRDSGDAKDWQDAVKQLLTDEVRARASRFAEDDRETLQVIHSSIELFQNNPDMVPGTKQFDRELADQFVKLAEPYEIRMDGKLSGYSIPVQPLIAKLRADVQAGRAVRAQAAQSAPAAAPAGKAGPRAGAPAGAPATVGAPPEAHQPQGGIQSRAGASTAEDDFSVLFGTIGLPTLRI